MKDDTKQFRMFNKEENEMIYFDFFDLSDKTVKLDFTYLNNPDNLIITAFTGMYDNSEIPLSLYDGDIIQVIKTNILNKDDTKIGIIEYVSNYAAYGIIFKENKSKLLYECYENTIIKLGNVFEENNKVNNNKVN